MTIEQRLIQRGKREGKREGAFKEKTTIALRMIGEGLPLSLIGNITGLSKEKLQALFNNHELA
jgi:predicted transposase YdaD